MKDKVIVITGASAGIGAAFAKLAGGRGAVPVLVARREPELDRAAAEAGPQAIALVGNMARRVDVERVCAETLSRCGQIDVWINNVGRGITRGVADLTDEDIDEMIQVNVKSAIYGIQAILPHFRARGTGHIINISSVLGRVPFAGFRSAYSAAKHALNALTANLRVDLAAELPGVHVSTVLPGPVATEFGINALGGGPDSRRFPGAQPPEEVAEVIAQVIAEPRADVYTRPHDQDLVARYYAAEDMGALEKQPPFLPTRKP